MQTLSFCGRETSCIALGTMDFGGRIGEGPARKILDAYVSIGGNFIDTARLYGDFAHGVPGGSEALIGRWMEERRCREAIVLGTKGGHPPLDNMRAGRLDRSSLLDDLRRSLDALRTPCVDIFWLHRDDPTRPVEDILTTLTELVERGLTRFVGVSNWPAPRIASALACAKDRGLVRLAANQPQFSLAPQVVVEDETLCQMDAACWQLHLREDLPCVCFSSQAKGFLAKMDAGAELSDKCRRRYLCPENLALLGRTRQLARELHASVAAISLAWLVSQPFPTIPIAGISRPEQLSALREAAGLRLTPAQRDFLRTV